jgi:hypothetical protein
MIESIQNAGIDLRIRDSLSFRYCAMKPEPLFYVERAEQNVAGPYDLVQMAGLLRRKIITAETSVRLEGEEDWKPFGWQPQFSIAREMSPDAVSKRVAELDDEAEEARQGPIPLPSRETLIKLGGLGVGALLTGAGAYLIASLDATTGYCLEYAGGAATLVAICMIMARVLDEDFWTLVLVFFVPFGDVYYFISNIWEYFAWFCVKYIGLAVCAGAAMGLAAR